MVGDAIALDSTNEPAGHFVVQDPEIDPIARDADLRLNANAPSREFHSDVTFEWRFCVGRNAYDRGAEPAMFGVGKELSKKRWAVRHNANRVYVMVAYGGKHHHLSP